MLDNHLKKVSHILQPLICILYMPKEMSVGIPKIISGNRNKNQT